MTAEEIDGDDSIDDNRDRYGEISETRDGDDLVLVWTPRNPRNPAREALRYDRANGILRFRPQSTEHDALADQYAHITAIEIDTPSWDEDRHSALSDFSMLVHVVGLPKAFSSTYHFGLGLKPRYSRLLDGIDANANCNTVRFTKPHDGNDAIEGAHDGVFCVSMKRLEDFVRAVERNRARAQTATTRVLIAEAHNATADLLGLDHVEPKWGRHPVIRALTEETSTGYVTTPDQRSTLVEAVREAAPEVAREAPQAMYSLRRDVELVSLEALVARFAHDLEGGHSSDEPHWQEFFDTNSFALQLLFSTPTVKRLAQAHVRSEDPAGGGSRIADFLCANAATKTAVVVEIKTPATKLIRTSQPYRGKGKSAVYAPHHELSGAVAQVQSQMASVSTSDFNPLRDERTDDLNVHDDVRGALIVGRYAALDAQQQLSFVRYRAGLSNVSIVCYDELLERLHALLRAIKEETA